MCSVSFTYFKIKFLDSFTQQMTTLSAGSITELADIFHPVTSDNGITAHEEGQADTAVIPDVSQSNEEDDEFISKSDLETDDEETSQKPQISERRRNQNRTFMSWCVHNISNSCSPRLTIPQDLQASRRGDKR